MRTSTLTLTVIALCLWSLPAHAQQQAENGATEEEGIVQVKIQSQIPKTSTAVQLPLLLMERLNGQ